MAATAWLAGREVPTAVIAEDWIPASHFCARLADAERCIEQLERENTELRRQLAQARRRPGSTRRHRTIGDSVLDASGAAPNEAEGDAGAGAAG